VEVRIQEVIKMDKVIDFVICLIFLVGMTMVVMTAEPQNGYVGGVVPKDGNPTPEELAKSGTGSVGPIYVTVSGGT
jgi:hypothetical protein